MTDPTGAGATRTSTPSKASILRRQRQGWSSSLPIRLVPRARVFVTLTLMALVLTATFSSRARSSFPRRSLLVGFVPQETASLLHRSWPVPFGGRSTVLAVANQNPAYRLPGEFEPQEGLLLSGDLAEGYEALFRQILEATHRTVRIVVLVNNDAQQQFVREIVCDGGVPPETISIVRGAHDSKWLRDFAPMVLLSRKAARPICLSMTYLGSRGHQVTNQAFAERLGFLTRHHSIHLDGGNLLSNGEGLCLTTSAVVEANPQLRKPQLAEALSAAFGLDQIVVLQRLAGEPTGHVDMFATFTSPDTVLVGSYDRQLDATNAAILDRNAEQLAGIRTHRGPLRVVRIPMPASLHGNWRTYTNVLYVNGTILMPVYGQETVVERQAVAAYARLLPDWQLVRIQADRLIAGGGALHCIAMNLASAGMLGSVAGQAAINAEPSGWFPAAHLAIK